ncbi:MAG: hypothetical protein KDD85_09860 [Parvularculaceae bacterium]|nr:hypothetical protein [Parvularculaceae bacterium]
MRLMMILTVGLLFVLAPSACTAKLSHAASADCTAVEIQALYANPETFNGKRICSDGVLLVLGPPQLAIVPPGTSLVGPWEKMLYVDGDPEASRRVLREKHFENGTMVRFWGTFTYDRDCWHAETLLPEDLICAPIQKPMFLREFTIMEAK